MTGSINNLWKLYEQADQIDRAEGFLAYRRYHNLMLDLADHWGASFPATIACFVSLSPNNDYVSNLRSTASVLEAIKLGRPVDDVVVSTYRHCLKRAYAYASGRLDFLAETKGQKVRSFYLNIYNPEDKRPVTIDGHMVGAWRDEALSMKQAIPRAREYDEIASAVRKMARKLGVVPNQVQATLWFARKRTLRVVYDAQHDLFFARDDVWKTQRCACDIKPFAGVAA